ncbi:hypothetical protein [Coxiella endosymbiont of Rhipicephalus microplus]|uniref:hypothetical protein n=1 Tax=Coxiella endosymbiont of Rhipicephalus microplus TaxID=1656186 RepID=UPI000C7FC329|nr:hypothetical protein [Coxiella endosymbiont of Rhipicephalus microplus]
MIEKSFNRILRIIEKAKKNIITVWSYVFWVLSVFMKQIYQHNSYFQIIEKLIRLKMLGNFVRRKDKIGVRTPFKAQQFINVEFPKNSVKQ